MQPFMREANAAAGREFASFNLVNRRLDKLTEFVALLVGDRSFQVLDFWQMLSHKNDQSDVANATDPRIANQLGIER